jgi:hypothetical protein
MSFIERLAVAPALAVAISGLTLTAAPATTEPLPADAVEALAVASCQLDPSTPLTAEEMNPVVLAQADVEVVPGEITAHLFRAEVATSAGDTQECTFGVLHRDVQLKQVQHVGAATLARVDEVAGTTQSVSTEIGLGNMGHGSAVDPTTELSLRGFLTPLDQAGTDPTYTISLHRKSIEVVQIAAHQDEAKAAAKLLKRQLKAAAHLEKKQLKAARGKHSDKAVAVAKRVHDRKVAAAQAAYERATTPKTVSRPISRAYTVTGSVSASS